MTREPMPPTPRKTMTRARRQLVLDAYLNRCAEPTCAKVLTVETAEIDHINLGGSDDFDNLQPLCAADHKIKTARDMAKIAKMRRRQRLGERKANRRVPAEASTPPAPARRAATLKETPDDLRYPQ